MSKESSETIIIKCKPEWDIKIKLCHPFLWKDIAQTLKRNIWPDKSDSKIQICLCRLTYKIHRKQRDANQ